MITIITTAGVTISAGTIGPTGAAGAAGANGAPGAQGPSGAVTGDGKLWFAATPPAGWLICDGSAISRTTFNALFLVIGTAWGVGDGTTTFNIPDLRDRTPIGVSPGTLSGRPTARALAATGGEESHTLANSELPQHTHGYYLGEADGYATVGTSNANTDVVSDVGNYNQTTDGGTGGGAAHNNMQPFAAVNFIIKT